MSSKTVNIFFHQKKFFILFESYSSWFLSLAWQWQTKCSQASYDDKTYTPSSKYDITSLNENIVGVRQSHWFCFLLNHPYQYHSSTTHSTRYHTTTTISYLISNHPRLGLGLMYWLGFLHGMNQIAQTNSKHIVVVFLDCCCCLLIFL